MCVYVPAELGFVASWAKPPPKMVKLITKAIVEWDMIKPGAPQPVTMYGLVR